MLDEIQILLQCAVSLVILRGRMPEGILPAVKALRSAIDGVNDAGNAEQAMLAIEDVLAARVLLVRALKSHGVAFRGDLPAQN